MQNWQKAEDIVYNYFSSRKDSYITRLKDTHDINAQLRRFGERPIILGKKRESDFIVIEDGITYFAEVKCTTNVKGVTKSLFSSQEGKRNRILRANGSYHYFIYSTVREQWYMVPAVVIAENPNRTWEELKLYKTSRLENVV